MNIRRIIFWGSFIVVIALIVWGLVVAMNKPPVDPLDFLGTPASVTTEDHIRGPMDAPVTLIEYSDYQCPACRAYYPIIEQLLADASTTVRFVYRHFPLYPLPHKNSFSAAQAAEAAGLQGKFWEMATILFDNQTEWQDVAKPESLFEGYATRLGLNLSVFRTDLGSERVKARVQRDLDESRSLSLTSTPTFFVNGIPITNPPTYEAFKERIDAAAQGNSN